MAGGRWPVDRAALRATVQVFLASRVLVIITAVTAALVWSPAGGRHERAFDAPALTHPFGGMLDALLSPLARWDAVWYLSIAHDGYGHSKPSAAFFPLYPLLVRLVGGFGSRGTLLLSAYAVSLGCFAAALYLLHRLVELELGRPLARSTLLLLALWPASLFFGAPYTESLFLLLSVAAFHSARTGRWAWAGCLCAAASATRSVGLVLVVPLSILWWQSARRSRRDLLWLALAPLGLVAFAVHLHQAQGDALAFLHAQRDWYHGFSYPLAAIRDGAVAAFDGARQLLSGQRAHVYFTRAGGDPFKIAEENLLLFGCLVLVLVALAGAVRRLPAAYGAYAAAALAVPLSSPVGPQPLMSLPRHVSVLFPLFMWLALALHGRRLAAPVLALFGAGLIAGTALFATWHWVA